MLTYFMLFTAIYCITLHTKHAFENSFQTSKQFAYTTNCKTYLKHFRKILMKMILDNTMKYCCMMMQ